MRVPRDNERAERIEHDVIRRERRRHARAQRQRLRGDVPRVEEDFAERRGRYRYLRTVRGDRDAIWEGNVRCNGFGVRRRRRRRRPGLVVCLLHGGGGGGARLCERDVGYPGEWEREERFGDGQCLSEHAREASGEAVVVGEIERGRAGQRERVGRHELRAGDRTYPLCTGGRVPRERELLDRAIVPRVVHDE